MLSGLQSCQDGGSVSHERLPLRRQLDRLRAVDDQCRTEMTSRAATCWLTADWVMPRACAASVKDPDRPAHRARAHYADESVAPLMLQQLHPLRLMNATSNVTSAGRRQGRRHTRSTAPDPRGRREPEAVRCHLIQVKLIENVFTPEQKQQIVRRLTDAMVEIEGENMRPVTWCVIDEVKSGDWGIAGNPLTTADVKALAAGATV